MHKFKTREAITFGAQTYKKNWKFFLVLFLMVWGASSILSWIGNAASGQLPLMGAVVRIVAWAAEMVIGIGLIKIAIDFATNRTPDYKDIYLHYKLFWKYLAASILYGLIILGGFILLVIPGIYFAIKYYFVLYLVVDKNMGPIEALKKSGKITQNVMLELLYLVVALIVLNIAGFLLFGIGLLVTIPISMVATAHIYKKLV